MGYFNKGLKNNMLTHGAIFLPERRHLMQQNTLLQLSDFQILIVSIINK